MFRIRGWSQTPVLRVQRDVELTQLLSIQVRILVPGWARVLGQRSFGVQAQPLRRFEASNAIFAIYCSCLPFFCFSFCSSGFRLPSFLPFLLSFLLSFYCSVYLLTHLSIHPFVHASTLSIWLSSCLSIYLSILQCILFSIYLNIYLPSPVMPRLLRLISFVVKSKAVLEGTSVVLKPIDSCAQALDEGMMNVRVRTKFCLRVVGGKCEKKERPGGFDSSGWPEATSL